MKRDLEIVRYILEQVDANVSAQPWITNTPLEAYHVALMMDAGLVEAEVVKGESGFPKHGIVTRLTWDGSDFIEAARIPKVWTLVKKYVLKPGAKASLSFLLVYIKTELIRALDQSE